MEFMPDLGIYCDAIFHSQNWNQTGKRLPVDEWKHIDILPLDAMIIPH